MSNFAELNRVLLDNVMELVRDGNYSKAKKLGFSDEQLRTLNLLKAWDVSDIIKCAPALVRLSVDTEVFESILKRINHDDSRESMIDQCLKAGASVQMMEAFFGFTGNDTSTRRQLLGIEPRQGRLSNPTEELSTDIYTYWMQVTEKNPQQRNAFELEIMLDVAQYTQAPLATVWSLVKEWQKC